MKYSLFRRKDIFEAFVCYCICFAFNIALTAIQGHDLAHSLLLFRFFEKLAEHQAKIVALMSLCISVIFHYQLISRKKVEIFCRFLVGDTMMKMKRRFVLHHLIVISTAFLASLALNIYFHIKLTLNIPLMMLFIFLALVATGKVSAYETV